MNKEVKSTLKKTVQIAGVTCVALGGAALIASGAALKALAEGAKFVKNSIQDIINEKPEEETAEAVEAEVVPKEEAGTAAEIAAEETAATEEVE